MVLGFNNPFAYPKSSFIQPVNPPTSEPDEGDLISVCFSKDWLPVVLGALSQLQLQTTWKTDDPSVVIVAQGRATNLINLFAQELCNTRPIPAPYWDDELTDDDELPADVQTWYGSVTDWLAPIGSLNFVENAAIWVITGFVAYAASIGAAIFFRTVARRFVIAVQKQDFGEIIRVIVDSTEYNVDTSLYAVGEIVEVPIVTTNGNPTHDIMIIGTGHAATRIVRKRLDEGEMDAVTDIRQVGGQMQIVKGGSGIWEDVSNADNVRRDGSTIITGQQQWRNGTASNALIKLNPDVGEKAIEIKLPISSTALAIQMLNSSNQQIFGVNGAGRFSLRGSDNNMFSIINSGGNAAVLFGTLSSNPLLTLTGQTGQSNSPFVVQNSSLLPLFLVGTQGSITARQSLIMQAATLSAERTVMSMVSTWDVQADATRRGKVTFNVNSWLGQVSPLALGVNSGGAPTVGFMGNNPIPAPLFTAPITNIPQSVVVLARALDDLGLINGTAYPINGIAPTVTGFTNDPALLNLLSVLASHDYIVDGTVSTQKLTGSITPLPSQATVGFLTAKPLLSGETYTIIVKGLISYDGGASGYSDACWEGDPSNSLTGSTGTKGKFKVGTLFIGGTESPQNITHSYQLDPYYSVSGGILQFSFSGYLPLPSGVFDVSIEGKFAN